MNQIFRQQVIDEQSNRLHGEVVMLPSVNYLWLAISIAAFLFIVLLWLSNTTYTRKEKVQGWVESKSGISNIYAARVGIIDKLLVKEGDNVQEGQPLARISFKAMLKDGEAYNDSIIREQVEQENSIKGQLARIDQIYDQKRQDYTQQIQYAKTTLNALTKQLQTKIELSAVLEKRFNRMQGLLSQGSVSTVQVEDAKQQLLIAESDKQEVDRICEQQKNNLAQIQSQLNLLASEKNNQVDLLKYQLNSNNRLLLQYKSEQDLLVYATKSGVVSNLQVREGQLLKNLDVPILSIAPLQDDIELQALVPMSSIGFVQVGQSIRIKYDTFPYQKFGFFSGKIIGISRGVLLPNEIAYLPIQLDKAYYKITIAPDLKKIQAYGKPTDIRPGMTFSADVILDHRSILEWLLDPIYSIKGSL